MKNKAILFTLLISMGLQFPSFAQWGMSLNTPESLDGYTLFNKDDNAGSVYLIDNCGEVVNSWLIGPQSYMPKILPNGNLLYLIRAGVTEKDWDNNVVNSVLHGDDELRLKYEVRILPNGNYLSVGRRDFTFSQFTEIGYNLEDVAPTEVDVVVELDRNTGEIVWEWNIADHVIQQRDSTLSNYGILSENPQLLNVDGVSLFDWEFQESFMINGMDYNPTLDQIVLSVRKMSEIIIIDHSTTTEEAAGHTGGTYEKGGDILYRWGNPQNYDRGTDDDRILFFQHNPNWITEGPLEGQIVCYNNGLNRPGVGLSDNYSTVPIIQPPLDANSSYILEDGLPYMPLQAPIEYSKVHTDTPFFSAYTSGAQQLPNGNIFITEGVDGRLLEIDSAGELVWEYTVPSSSYLFRANRYEIDYAAFVDRDMAPDGTVVPNDFSFYDCTLYGETNTQTIITDSDNFKVSFKDIDKELAISNVFGRSFSFGIFNMQGQSLIQQNATAQTQLNLGHLAKGMYVLRIDDHKSNDGLTKKIIIQ